MLSVLAVDPGAAVRQDPLWMILALAGLVPPLLVVYWVNMRTWGTIKPDIEIPRQGLGALVTLAGGAAIFLGVGELLSLLDVPYRTFDLLLAYALGTATTLPCSAWYLWATRRHWRSPEAREAAMREQSERRRRFARP